MNGKLVHGFGICEKGEYKASENGKPTKVYGCWNSMVTRCYSEKQQERTPTYKGCTICLEWKYFQGFATWYFENYYEICLLGRTELDKDILAKGNKIYSPSTCCFVPRSINSLLVKSDKTRGYCLIGVTYYPASKKFRAYCRNGTGKLIHLGYFNTKEEAFETYKAFKEFHIKEVATLYKDELPANVYTALMHYEVDILD